MTTITVDDIISIARTLPRETMNPTNDYGACIYTGADGSHCIAGEILVRLGVPVPGFGHLDSSETVSMLLDGRTDFSDEAVALLSDLQREADESTFRHVPDAWGRAMDLAGVSDHD